MCPVPETPFNPWQRANYVRFTPFFEGGRLRIEKPAETMDDTGYIYFGYHSLVSIRPNSLYL